MSGARRPGFITAVLTGEQPAPHVDPSTPHTSDPGIPHLSDAGKPALDAWAEKAYAALPALPTKEQALGFAGREWVSAGADEGLVLNSRDTLAVGARFADVYEASPGITKLLLKASGQVPGARLEGLAHRLMEGEALCRRVAGEIRDLAGHGEWSTSGRRQAAIKALVAEQVDIARYTVVAEPGDYVRVVEAVTAELRVVAEPVEGSWKNSWTAPGGVRSIDTAWRDPASGVMFEVRFHTPDSLDAATAEHPLRQARLAGRLSGPDLAANLAASREILDQVPVVDGAGKIPQAAPTTPDHTTGAGMPAGSGGHGPVSSPPSHVASGPVAGPAVPEVRLVVDQPDVVPHDPQDPGSKPPLVYVVPKGADGRPLPLFDGAPRREQTIQGVLADCGVVATIGAVAGHLPSTVSQMIVQNPDGSFTVTLREVEQDGTQLRYLPTGRVYRITVTADVPAIAWMPERVAYMRQDAAAVSWASVLEKAVAGVDAGWTTQRESLDWTGERGYHRLGQGSFATDRAELLAQLTGEPAVVRHLDGTPGQEAAVEAQLRAELDAARPVLIEVPEADPNVHPCLPHGLVGNHVYEVVAVDKGFVQLRNPWNVDHPTPMTVREFLDLVAPFYSTLE